MCVKVPEISIGITYINSAEYVYTGLIFLCSSINLQLDYHSKCSNSFLCRTIFVKLTPAVYDKLRKNANIKILYVRIFSD